MGTNVLWYDGTQWKLGDKRQGKISFLHFISVRLDSPEAKNLTVITVKTSLSAAEICSLIFVVAI